MNYLIRFSLALLMVTATVGRQGVGDRPENLYQEIPGQQRELLKQTLNKLVESEKSRDWKSVYALLAKQPTETEDSFVSKMKRTHALLEFRPSKLTFMPPDSSWDIKGCASFKGDRAGRGRVASVHAHWVDSQWYLSPVVVDLFGSEKKMTPRECSIPKATPTSMTHGNSSSASAIFSPMFTMR